jgi:hypothetical protein
MGTGDCLIHITGSLKVLVQALCSCNINGIARETNSTHTQEDNAEVHTSTHDCLGLTPGARYIELTPIYRGVA